MVNIIINRNIRSIIGIGIIGIGSRIIGDRHGQKSAIVVLVVGTSSSTNQNNTSHRPSSCCIELG